MLKLTGYIIGEQGIAVGDVDIIYNSMKLKNFPGNVWEFDFYPNPANPSPDVETWVLDVTSDPTKPYVKFEGPARTLIEHEALKHIYVEGGHEVPQFHKGWFFGSSQGTVYGEAVFYNTSIGLVTAGKAWFYQNSVGEICAGTAWFMNSAVGYVHGGEAWFFKCSKATSYGGSTILCDGSKGLADGGDVSCYGFSECDVAGGVVRFFNHSVVTRNRSTGGKVIENTFRSLIPEWETL